MNGRAARIAGALPRGVMTVFALVAAIALYRAVRSIGLEVSFDPNEGWNAYHALGALNGHLYPPRTSYLVNNYPPLSFYVVGALGRQLGDMIVAGRIVSLASFAAVCVAIFEAARIMGCRAVEALLGAFFFAAALLLGTDYVGMDDPQLLGHALQTCALLAVLVPRARRPVAGAALMVLALFVKHNLIALPLAIALWLAVCDRQAAWRFVLAGVAFSLLGVAVFRAATGTDWVSHLSSARMYSFALLEAGTVAWLEWAAIPLAATILLVVRWPEDRSAVFAGCYAALALVLGIGFSGGAGVDANAFFDADIAVSLGMALALNRFASEMRAALAAALLVPLAIGLAGVYDPDARDPDYWFHPLADDARLAKIDIDFLKAHRGSALCETLALCYWAGKAPEVDVFNTGQAFATGARNDSDLVNRIQAHRFAAIEFDSLQPFALTPAIRAALLARYRIDHSDDDGVFLLPR